jgi:hypothetical protein
MFPNADFASAVHAAGEAWIGSSGPAQPGGWHGRGPYSQADDRRSRYGLRAAGCECRPGRRADSKTVNPLPDSTPTQNNTPHAQAPAATYITHGFVIAPQSREVIYRVMDMRTRQVLWQVPDAALLRSRAYAQALKDGCGSRLATSPLDRRRGMRPLRYLCATRP